MSLSDWELGVASGLQDMKEKLSLCEVGRCNMMPSHMVNTLFPTLVAKPHSPEANRECKC